MEQQARIYDKKAEDEIRKSERAKIAYKDVRKNGKKSKYYDEYLNPDDESTVSNVKSSAKAAIEYHQRQAKTNRQVSDIIRKTEFGKKSIVEVANQKEQISKGVTAAVALSGISVAAVMKDKKIINNGQLAVAIMMTGTATAYTRYKTYTNVYVEKNKRNKQ